MFLFTQNVLMFLIQLRKGTEFKLKVGRDIQNFLHKDRKSTNCVFIYSIFDFKLKRLEMFLVVHPTSPFSFKRFQMETKTKKYTHILFIII